MALLDTGYGETRQAIGLSANGTLIEIYANLQGGSWTITVTAPGGLTCLVDAGEGYEAIVEALPPAGVDG
jgi:hypothetical protein